MHQEFVDGVGAGIVGVVGVLVQVDVVPGDDVGGVVVPVDVEGGVVRLHAFAEVMRAFWMAQAIAVLDAQVTELTF